MIDICIPHYGVGRLTELALACLASIRAHSDPDGYRLILVDNASPEWPALAGELSEHRNVEVIRNSANLGYVKATNQALRLSDAPYVVLLNNDTEAAPRWLELLQLAIDSFPAAGLAGPFASGETSWQGRARARFEASGRPHPGPRVMRRGTMLAFFCVMISRATLERVGRLSEAFGVGLGDDDDYCRRAQAAGFDLVLQQDLVIHHHHRSTFRTLYSAEQIAEMQRAAMRLLGETV